MWTWTTKRDTLTHPLIYSGLDVVMAVAERNSNCPKFFVTVLEAASVSTPEGGGPHWVLPCYWWRAAPAELERREFEVTGPQYLASKSLELTAYTPHPVKSAGEEAEPSVNMLTSGDRKEEGLLPSLAPFSGRWLLNIVMSSLRLGLLLQGVGGVDPRQSLQSNSVKYTVGGIEGLEYEIRTEKWLVGDGHPVVLVVTEGNEARREIIIIVISAFQDLYNGI